MATAALWLAISALGVGRCAGQEPIAFEGQDDLSLDYLQYSQTVLPSGTSPDEEPVALDDPWENAFRGARSSQRVRQRYSSQARAERPRFVGRSESASYFSAPAPAAHSNDSTASLDGSGPWDESPLEYELASQRKLPVWLSEQDFGEAGAKVAPMMERPEPLPTWADGSPTPPSESRVSATLTIPNPLHDDGAEGIWLGSAPQQHLSNGLIEYQATPSAHDESWKTDAMQAPSAPLQLPSPVSTSESRNGSWLDSPNQSPYTVTGALDVEQADIEQAPQFKELPLIQAAPSPVSPLNPFVKQGQAARLPRAAYVRLSSGVSLTQAIQPLPQGETTPTQAET
ncbi:MAG: hypothetical protein KDA61_13550, partial [Planctomycetales bacterium]|nr:hypothetical protein [Planctomycetales bacterium]